MHRVIVLEKAEDFTGKHGTELRDKGYEIFRTRSIREACGGKRQKRYRDSG